MTDSPERDGAHDFDFLFGSWHVANRRLVSRLTGSTEWEEFEADQTCRPILGGQGNIDDFRPTNWHGHEGFEGGALRLYDRDREEWRIYWMSTASGALDAPMIGSFCDGVGTFYADEFHDGKPVVCRFLWQGIRENRATWEQALSPDGGRTWETNWVMNLTRVS